MFFLPEFVYILAKLAQLKTAELAISSLVQIVPMDAQKTTTELKNNDSLVSSGFLSGFLDIYLLWL